MHDYVRIGLLYHLYIFSDFFNAPVEFEIDKTSSVQVGVVSLQLALRKCYVENFAKGALNFHSNHVYFISGYILIF